MSEKMDKSKRQFIKLLPLAAITGTAVKVGAIDAKAVEMKANKKYVFRVPVNTDPSSLEWFSKFLREERGIDATLVTDNVEIFELG
jgi:hypothetical protein